MPEHKRFSELDELAQSLDSHIADPNWPSEPPSADVAAFRAARRPLLLLGLMSGSATRRALIRCTWGQLVDRTSVRMLFVVGEGASDAEADDTLVAQGVQDKAMIRGTNQGIKAFLKMVAFLRFAARPMTRPEQWMRHGRQHPPRVVAVADDDVFIQPTALLAYARELLASSDAEAFAAGQFDWYSVFPATLRPVGWDRVMSGALFHAQKRHHNCTTLRHPHHAAAGEPSDGFRCVGPFAFAKGPLLLLSSPVVEWLVHGAGAAAFARDAAVASAAASASPTTSTTREERRRRGSPPQLVQGAVYDDATLGYWLRAHPSLQLVALPKFVGWASTWKDVGPLNKLLVAHRVPWHQYAWLSGATDAMWGGDATLGVAWQCGGAPCSQTICMGHGPSDTTVGGPCCAQAAGQRACALAVTAQLDRGITAQCYNCACWRAKLAGPPCRSTRCAARRPPPDALDVSPGKCNFSRWSEPQLPAQCWRV